MNVLVLIARGQVLHGSGFQVPQTEPVFHGRIECWQATERPLTEQLRTLARGANGMAKGFAPDVLAVHLSYAGGALRGPALATEELLTALRSVVGESPLLLPHLLHLVECAGQAFPEIPLVLLAETAFFADLPPREALYGLNPDLMARLTMRRYGFHGLYHEAAAAHLAVRRRQQGLNGSLRLLSLCMEPRPEAAAIIDHRPVMVTGGTTPLEGILGQTTCGEIDPSIVLTLAQKLNLGPEQINSLLTTQSGLLGLVGRPTSWDEVFGSDEPQLAAARKVVEHQLLQACGAGMAAMGGLDAIVFSGRYHDTGRILGPWLQEKLAFKQPPDLSWECFAQPLEQVLCEAAVPLAVQAPCRSGKVPVADRS